MTHRPNTWHIAVTEFVAALLSTPGKFDLSYCKRCGESESGTGRRNHILSHIALRRAPSNLIDRASPGGSSIRKASDILSMKKSAKKILAAHLVEFLVSVVDSPTLG